jgi:hypothetical protein
MNKLKIQIPQCEAKLRHYITRAKSIDKISYENDAYHVTVSQCMGKKSCNQSNK